MPYIDRWLFIVLTGSQICSRTDKHMIVKPLSLRRRRPGRGARLLLLSSLTWDRDCNGDLASPDVAGTELERLERRPISVGVQLFTEEAIFPGT